MTEHRDVAAYALGLLDDRAASHFEEHLLDCESCAAELDSMVPVMEALADVDPVTLVEPAAAPAPQRLSAPGRRHDSAHPAGHPGSGGRREALLRPLKRHRLAGRPRALVAAAAFGAVALLAVGGLIVGARWSGSDPPRIQAENTSGTQNPARTAPPLGLGGPEAPAGKKYEATDPVTGVHALVLLERKAWGSQLSYAISQLTGPLTCRLTLVRANGTTETLASWKVPPAGYGTPKQPQPLELQTATATDPDDLALVQVQAVAPNGVVKTLVEIPL
ncbi:zf-HC2 domain-containing protein [Rhizomonospora bruguierae]|uniref:zf-HC2 domain-containing protein n=1 Tax=Rhizomonospora bruguierae TaxID=1581705 RepID=UPI001BCEA246|nr:zf-HC2 domain-containing protein [Micromonospora sp. NBRC 107566]